MFPKNFNTMMMYLVLPIQYTQTQNKIIAIAAMAKQKH